MQGLYDNEGVKDPKGKLEVTQKSDSQYTIVDHKFETRCSKKPNANAEQAFRVAAKELNKLKEFSHKDSKAQDMIAPKMSGILDSIHYAFMDHHPLILSVSDFNLLIAQGLAHHMTVHAEEVRKEFVDFEGKEEVIVFSPEYPEKLIDDMPKFANMISKKIKKDIYEVIYDNSSVATKTTQLCSQIAMLDCMKHYFNITRCMGCGIPKLTIKGSVEDWEKLQQKVAKLKNLNKGNKLKLEFWLEHLEPTVDLLVKQTTKREADEEFWRSIYRYNASSGGVWVSGWYSGFIPYLCDDKGAYYENKYLNSYFTKDPRYGAPPTHLPNAICSIPCVIRNIQTGEEEETMVYGGWLGPKIHKDGAIEPIQGWGITFKDTPDTSDLVKEFEKTIQLRNKRGFMM